MVLPVECFFIFRGFFPKGRPRIKKCWGWENKCNQYLWFNVSKYKNYLRKTMILFNILIFPPDPSGDVSSLRRDFSQCKFRFSTAWECTFFNLTGYCPLTGWWFSPVWVEISPQCGWGFSPVVMWIHPGWVRILCCLSMARYFPNTKWGFPQVCV